jgi:hypothetical protein
LSVNHQKEYVRGRIHTNTIESFWAIVKRGIVGHNFTKYRQNTCICTLMSFVGDLTIVIMTAGLMIY